MQTSIECVPCFVRQALDAIRFASPDVSVHERLLRDVLLEVANMDMMMSPPRMAQRIHRAVRALTGNADPYAQVKRLFNDLAVKVRDDKRLEIAASDDPLQAAVKLAIAGNVIDFGVRADLSPAHLDSAIDHAASAELGGDWQALRDAVTAARTLLLLADNAGEIAFDVLLVEQMRAKDVTVAVRGAPVINDATVVDAKQVGMTAVATVIDNGSDAPGTILEDCSEAFVQRFHESDVVIAKGQGNYETLSEAPREVFFLLKAKCPVIANDIGCEVGSVVVRRGGCTGDTA